MMTNFLYNFGVNSYGFALKIAAFFHPKAAKWVAGRKDWEQKLRDKLGEKSTWFWFHCASLGEFEQGRNIIEYVKKHQADTGIIVTFFSPSGYEIRKNYAHADAVCYLPLDTPQNARKFLDILSPQLAVFIKYELWINFLQELAHRNIPTLLVSARVQANSSFFKPPFASLYKEVFASFAKIFTQDEVSAKLIGEFSENPEIVVSSDTRYDRVKSNFDSFIPIPEIQQFKKERLCIIAGSSWPKGEELLLTAFDSLAQTHDICLILAPHEIRESRISTWEAKYPKISLRFSQIEQLTEAHKILWIDNIGMLSRLYHYGDIAYVGGGWGSGLHNILEAATFGCPVLIGPVHEKFPEASEMIAAGGCFEIQDLASIQSQLEILINSRELRQKIHRINTEFIEERSGATDMILSWMKEKGFIA